MGFTQNCWGQRDITNKIKVLTKQGTDMIYAVITKKYQKYPSTTIIEHKDVFDKVNNLPWGCLQNMTPNNAYNIPIYVLTMTLADICHGQKY